MNKSKCEFRSRSMSGSRSGSRSGFWSWSGFWSGSWFRYESSMKSWRDG